MIPTKKGKILKLRLELIAADIAAIRRYYVLIRSTEQDRIGFSASVTVSA